MYSTASSYARAFYDEQSDSAIGRFAKVEAAINSGDFLTAQSQNSFSPANNLELKQQQVNSVKIKLADTTQTLSAADTTLLFFIAEGCPEVDGIAFYEARTLLNIIYGQPLIFTSNCVSQNVYRLGKGSHVLANNLNAEITVYPNPNTGKFKVLVEGVLRQEITIELRNSLGELTLKKTVVTDNKGEFQLDEIRQGIYVLKICNGSKIYMAKVIVNP